MDRKRPRNDRLDDPEPLAPDDAEQLLSIGIQAALRGDWDLAQRAVGLGERILRAQKLLLELEPDVFAWADERRRDRRAARGDS